MSPTRLPGTPSLLRAINDRAALDLLLDKGPLTRAQLGELTGLSKVTASQLVERLEERQLVARVGELAGGRGPNAQLYAVVPSSAYVIGVEVGPNQVVAASADITGAVTSRIEVTTRGADDPVGVVHSAVIEAATQADAPWQRVRRVVLGTPGLVDPATGDIAFAVDLPKWHHGLLAQLRSDLDRPVSFENDVNLAAVAEARIGAAQGVDDFVLIWLSRGVGLAVVLGGKMHRGHSGGAGEIGYLPVPGAPLPDDARQRSHRGLTGSFQRTVSAEAVRDLAGTAGFTAAGGAAALADAVAAGTRGEPVLDELARRVALGVVAVCVVLDPSLVVLAGEVGGAGGAALASRVQEQVTRLAPVAPTVVTTQVPHDAVLRGALLTAVTTTREEVFTTTIA